MPLKDVQQPQIVNLSEEIRLVAYDKNHESCLQWYQDEFIYYNSEGIVDVDKIPDELYLMRMYTYLDNNSELYFIEGYDGTSYKRIGDVAIKPVNPPIVIGNPDFRGKGYSILIMKYVIKRLKELGFSRIENSQVYKHNLISQKMHLSLGFEVVLENEDTYFFSLVL